MTGIGIGGGTGELKQGTGGPVHWKPRRKRDLRSKRTIYSAKVKCVCSTTLVSAGTSRRRWYRAQFVMASEGRQNILIWP